MKTVRVARPRSRAFTIKKLSFALGALVALSWVNGCSNEASPTAGASAPAGAGQGESTGTVGLSLDIAPGVTLKTVTYDIVDAGGAVVRSGTIDVTNSTKVSAIVSGVPAGSGYTVTLSATSVDGSVSCAGKSAPFQVTASATTTVTVLLECRIGGDAGTVIINGGTNVCPQIASATISPAETTVGNTVSLSALGSDPDGDKLTYAWTATGPGTIAGGSSADATFTCTGAGAATVTLVVSDGDAGCDATASYPITCDNPQGVTLHPNAHAADTATMAALTKYDADSGILTFSSMTPQLKSLTENDVLMAGAPVGPNGAPVSIPASSPAPRGFLRKVSSVKTVGSEVQVATTPATLKDAVASAFVDTTQHYADATGAVFTSATAGASLVPVGQSVGGIQNLPAGGLGGLGRGGLRGVDPLPPGPSTGVGPSPTSGLTLHLDNVVLSSANNQLGSGDTTGNASAQVTLNGWVNLDPSVFVHVDIEGCGLFCTYVREFDAGVTLNQSSDVQANFDLSGGVQYETTLGTIELPGFWTYWLYWQPHFEVKAGVSVSGEIVVTLHATDQIHLQGGAQWNDDHMGHSGWKNLSQASASSTFDIPYLQASVTAQAYVKPEFDILLFDVLGPDVSTQIGLVFDFGVPRRPFLDLKLALTQAVGVKISAFGFWEVDYQANLPEIDIPLGQSPNIPPFILGTSPAGGTSSPLAGLQFAVNAFDLQDGTNLTYTWTDETGAVLGTGNPLTAPANLSVGTHDVTVTVTDAVGDHSSATIHGVIVQAPPVSLQAFLPPITQSGQAPDNVSTQDIGNCLPSPELDVVGSAQGGTPPYTYGWKVTPLQANGITPNVSPISLAPISSTATTATLATSQFPGSWSSDLAASLRVTGEPVDVTFLVTDAAGSTSFASQRLNWVCAVVCGHAGEACCTTGNACLGGDYCSSSNTCAACPATGSSLIVGSETRQFHPACFSGQSTTDIVGGACTPGYHFSSAQTTSHADAVYGNSSCSYQWNARGPGDCSVTVTYDWDSSGLCGAPSPPTFQCTTTVYEVPDVPAGCPGG